MLFSSISEPSPSHLRRNNPTFGSGVRIQGSCLTLRRSPSNLWQLVTELGTKLGTSWGHHRQLYRQHYRHCRKHPISGSRSFVSLAGHWRMHRWPPGTYPCHLLALAFFLLARHSPSELVLCSCFVRQLTWFAPHDRFPCYAAVLVFRLLLSFDFVFFLLARHSQNKF